MKTLTNVADKKELIDRLKTLTNKCPRTWGKMSSHQMVCHLNDSFKAAMGEKEVSSATSLFNRTILKWAGLYLPILWPRDIPTRPEIDQNEGGTRPVAFERDLRELELIIERFARRGRESYWHPHPLFGSMSVSEWQRWAYLHVDHHLRQFGR
jgi:hypothetical protein